MHHISRAGLAAALLTTIVVVPAQAALEGPVSVRDPITAAPEGGPFVDPTYAVHQTADGVVYGQSVNVNGVLQDLVLSVYEPMGDTSQFRPVIVWAAGGGFTQNRGRDRTYFMPELVRRGYVVVSIEYRIRPDMPYGFEGIVAAGPPAIQEAQAAAHDAQHDMQAAIRWVRRHAADLRIDQGRVIAAGYSAGAIMSLMTAFNSDDPGESGNPGWASHVVAAVSGAGAYLPGVQGTIEPGEPPVTMFHGTQDTVVPTPSAAPVCLATRAVGNVCELHLYPGEDHSIDDFDSMTVETVSFLYRLVIARVRTASQLSHLAAVTNADTVTVTGTLLDGAGAPLAGDRVLARSSTGGWSDTTTALDGSFALLVAASGHGDLSEILVRYEGRSHANQLLTEDVAPAAATVAASWSD